MAAELPNGDTSPLVTCLKRARQVLEVVRVQASVFYLRHFIGDNVPRISALCCFCRTRT